MAQVDYFLKIDGIEGESQDAMHKGEIAIDSWTWGERHPTSPGGGGGGAGRVSMNDFTFTMPFSKASPKLFLACAEGDHIKVAWLTARRGGGPKKDDYFLKWSFSDLLVSSYETDADDSQRPVDRVGFSFGKIEVEYKEQQQDGSLGNSTKAGWDANKNTAF